VIFTILLTAGNKKNEVTSNDYGVHIWRSENCAACHSVFGLGGHIGPDLTNIYSKRSVSYLNNILKNGMQNMPNLNLTKKERIALITYLKHINSLGVYPLKSFSNPFGIAK